MRNAFNDLSDLSPLYSIRRVFLVLHASLTGTKDFSTFLFKAAAGGLLWVVLRGAGVLAKRLALQAGNASTVDGVISVWR